MELKAQYAKRNKLEIALYELHLRVSKNLNSVEFDNFISKTTQMNTVIENKMRNKETTQNNKLERQITRQRRTANVNNVPTVNVDNVHPEQHSTQSL